MNQYVSIKIELLGQSEKRVQFSSDLLLVFTLQDGNTILVNQQQHSLEFGGLLCIPPFSHFVMPNQMKNWGIMLHIPQEVLQINGLGEQPMQIRCYISDASPGAYGEYDQIRMHYARIFNAYFQNSPQRISRVVAATSQLLSVLTEYFAIPNYGDNICSDCESGRFRFERILNYVHEHYSESVTIGQIAQQEFISVGYLSRIFKKHTGSTLTKYLTELRLQNARKDLASTGKSISDIAYTNGFSSLNSFIAYFKAKYGDTPKQYQKHILKEKAVIQEKGSPPNHHKISEFLQYASLENQFTSRPILPTEMRKAEVVDQPGRSLRHTWHRLLNIGYARDGLIAEVQNQIRQAQEQIGFEYLRFHGILDDDMHLYHEDENCRPFLDFSRVDLLLDFLLSQGMKPYIEFGFVPKLLASKEIQLYDRISFCTIFNNEAKWKFLIQGLIRHCIERYGRSCVLQWRFTTIGIHIVSVDVLSLDDYLTLYRTTYESVKEIDSNLQFGGPGGMASSIWDSHTIHDFLKFTKENECVPDFICTQCYPHRAIEQDSKFMYFSVSQSSAPSVLSDDEHYTRTVLRDYHKLLNEYGLSKLKIWIEEWNSTLWQRDLSSDTCYKAAWLAKNLCENYDGAESFGYWLLSDFIEERAAFGRVFHGGYGLFTYNGIPKSGWRAMQLVNMLGDTLLASGEGWMVTKSAISIQIMLNHYCHYDTLYQLRYQMLTDPQNAYSVFIERGPLQYTIRLTGLADGQYELKRYSISQKHGSSFDAWLDIGSPNYLHTDEMEYLKNASQPQYYIGSLGLRDEHIFSSMLEPHEMQVISISSAQLGSHIFLKL